MSLFGSSKSSSPSTQSDLSVNGSKFGGSNNALSANSVQFNKPTYGDATPVAVSRNVTVVAVVGLGLLGVWFVLKSYRNG
jgi:hypothetical protein